jgi:hypothetical protein
MKMRLTKLTYTLFFLLYATVTFAIPGVSGEQTQSITKNSVRLLATINANGRFTTVAFEIGTVPNLATYNTINASGASSGFVQNAVDPTGLLNGTTYYWRVYAYNGDGAVRSTINSFTTLPNDLVPLISNVSSNTVTNTSAKINYTVVNGTITSKIWYGTTAGMLTNSLVATSGISPLVTDATLTGLTNGTRYYYQVEATNNIGTDRSVEASFFTLTPNLVASFKFDGDKTSIDGNLTFGAGANTFVNDRNLNPNKAIQFANNRINVAIPGLPAAMATRTISVWAKFDSYLTLNYNFIFGYGIGSNGAAYGVAIYKDGSNNHTVRNYAYADEITGTPNPFDVFAWHHYVTTYQGNTAKLDVDGVLMNSTAKAWNTAGGNFYLGGNSFDASNFTGAIDDLVIYNRVFTDAEVNSLYLSTVGTLPVTLISYTAKAQNNNAVLNWKTASEINNSHFVVEHCIDGKTFNQIAIVNAKSTQGADYTYTDYNTTSGTNYYRLQQVDLDGKTTDLGVKSVKFNLQEVAIDAYPNPATDFVNLSFEPGIFDTAILIDVNGKVMNTIKIASVQNIAKIDLSNVTTGTYLVQLIGANAKTTKKVIKR